MKTTQKQSGSAHVIIIVVLALVIAGLLGFVFWQNFIVKKDDGKSVTQQSTGTGTEKTETKGEDNLTYKGSDFTFQYPKSGWTIKETSYNDGTNRTTELATDNYSLTGMGVASGAVVTVNVSNTSKSLDEEYAQLESDKATFGLEDLRKATTNGMPSVTYHSAYEGVRYHTLLVHGGMAYDLVYRFENNSDASKYMDAYTLVTSTFSFVK